MGSGSFDASAYRSYARTTVGKTTDEIYSSRSIHKNLNPKGVKIRESRDSADNPQSTPIIVAIDVTGSMGMIADALARKGLGTLFTELLEGKIVTNPHVMFMAVGDAYCDEAPLQVSQFEADNRIIEQLTQIYIEHGGGGNNFESYNLPWYFASEHTEHDSLIKRGKRGYLFTVGDEQAPDALTPEQIKTIIGDDVKEQMSSKDMLHEAQRKYDVFHVVVNEGDYASHHRNEVLKSWTPLLGQHLIQMKDHTKLSEIVVSAIGVCEGHTAEKVAGKFGLDVVSSVKHLTGRKVPTLALNA